LMQCTDLLNAARSCFQRLSVAVRVNHDDAATISRF
jgi:hypothetical protein